MKSHFTLAPMSGAGQDSVDAGVIDLKGTRSEALLFVPEKAQEKPWPLLVFFHGAGGNAQQSIDLMSAYAALHGVVVLAPSSVEYTWDVIVGAPGPDVENLNSLLGQTAEMVAVDTGCVALGGFSDGGSYALTVGLGNPKTVGTVIAFSPGFVVDGEPAKRPRVFIAHGDDDRVLPIDRTSRMILPRLRDGGYEVEYHQFAGGHTVPTSAAQHAFQWWLVPETP